MHLVNRFTLQRDTDEEVREFLQNNLHLQGKVLVPLLYGPPRTQVS